MTSGIDAPEIAAPDVPAAANAIDLADQVVKSAIHPLASSGGPDVNQVLAYDIAHAAAGVATAKSLLDYGAKGDVEARITCAFAADVLHDLSAKVIGREAMWGVERDPLGKAHDFITAYRAPEFVASLADQPGPRHLDNDMEMVPTRSDRSPVTSSNPTPSTSIARTGTCRRRSSPGSPNSARSASACRPSTAATARAATPNTWAWSWPPRNSHGPASVSAAR